MDRKNRQHARTPVDVDVRVSTIDPEIDPETGRRYYRAAEETCATLSPGGAFFKSLDPPPPGRRVVVQIHVPGNESPIETTGRIAWSRRELDPAAADLDEGGAGVAFDADPEAEAALAHFLAAQRQSK